MGPKGEAEKTKYRATLTRLAETLQQKQHLTLTEVLIYSILFILEIQ